MITVGYNVVPERVFLNVTVYLCGLRIDLSKNIDLSMVCSIGKTGLRKKKGPSWTLFYLIYENFSTDLVPLSIDHIMG